MDRAKVQTVPKLLATFFVVQNFDVHLTLVSDASTDFSDRDGGCGGALEHAAIPSEHFFGSVTGQIEKGVVGQHDRQVRLSCVTHNHWHTCAFKCRRCQFLSIGEDFL